MTGGWAGVKPQLERSAYVLFGAQIDPSLTTVPKTVPFDAVVQEAPPPGSYPSAYALNRSDLTSRPGALLMGRNWQNPGTGGLEPNFTQDSDLWSDGFHHQNYPISTSHAAVLDTDPVFIQIVKCYQGDLTSGNPCGDDLTTYPPTVKYAQNWASEGSGADVLWVRALARYKPGFTLNGDPCGGNPAWKFLFTHFQREFELYNSDAFFNVRNTYGGTESRLPNSPPGGPTMYKVEGEWTDGDWYEYISCDERLAADHYRNRRWIKKYGAPGLPSRRHGWESTGADVPSGHGTGFELGINKNRPTANGNVQWWWWGPWEAIDGGIYADPYGLAGDML